MQADKAGGESVLTPILRAGVYGSSGGKYLVPLADYSMYTQLAGEVAQTVAKSGEDGLLLVLDSHTAREAKGIEAAQAVADHVYLFGLPSVGWCSAPNITHCQSEIKGLGRRDRFLIAYSSSMHAALVGQWESESTDKPWRFRGGWTGHRPYVKEMGVTLLDRMGCESQDLFSAWNPDAVEFSSTLTMRLAALQWGRESTQVAGVPVGRDDLLSVLEILKAISTERRSHDVLFVFVEQIARVVDVDRCSVVRVWDDDDVGHVLASHEDETVDGLVIELDKYPELARAMESGSKVVIDDVQRDPLTRAFADRLSKAKVRSLLVVPIVLFDEEVGSLFLRVARQHNPFTLREMSFCEIVAEAASNALERAQLFDTIQRANERLEQLAITDGLTNLYNHRFFRQRLEEEFERARRYNLPLSCLMFDIDDFKEINDTFGHLQGDRVLRELAERVEGIVRKSDIVARYGGEEFAVIMPLTGVEGAKAEAERLRMHIGDHPFGSLPADWRVTVSVGVGVYDHEAVSEYEALLRVADRALYEAKRAGKNRVVVSSD